jgi:hypothetical protein
MTEGPPERRSTRRFGLRLPVSVSFPDTKGTEAETRDVSARGISFSVDAGMAAGTELEFTLTLPPEITATDSIRVRCKGKVVRVETGGVGGKTSVAAVIHEYEFLSEP